VDERVVRVVDLDGPAVRRQGLRLGVRRLQPGWRAHVVERRFLPKLVVTNALPTAARGGFAGRARANVADVPGLYVAGDWVGASGCLADASLGSASDAVEAAAGDRPPREARSAAAALT
jgi:hypothetical protein